MEMVLLIYLAFCVSAPVIGMLVTELAMNAPRGPGHRALVEVSRSSA